jgi:hypothetical protein
MEKRPIGKERLGAIVAFPRSQYKGLEMTGTMPCREDYTVKEVQVEGMGVVKMVRSERVPHRTMQVFECHSDTEFDQCLGKLLGMGETPAYIEGDTSFMVLFVGSEENVTLTQENYKEVDAGICRERDQAARWWKMYGRGKM